MCRKGLLNVRADLERVRTDFVDPDAAVVGATDVLRKVLAQFGGEFSSNEAMVLYPAMKAFKRLAEIIPTLRHGLGPDETAYAGNPLTHDLIPVDLTARSL